MLPPTLQPGRNWPTPLRLMIYHADRGSEDDEQLKRLNAEVRSA